MVLGIVALRHPYTLLGLEAYAIHTLLGLKALRHPRTLPGLEALLINSFDSNKFY